MKVVRNGSFEDAVAVLVDPNDDGVTAGTCRRGLLVLGWGCRGGLNTSCVMPGTNSTTTR
jgi:hypothetical protein